MAFVAGQWLGQLVQATAGLAGLGTVVATAGGGASGSIVDYAAITSGVAPRPERRAAADGVCLQPYTSGSTGRPKGVLLTHAGQYWNADLVRQVEAIVPRRPGPDRDSAPALVAVVDQQRLYRAGSPAGGGGDVAAADGDAGAGAGAGGFDRRL